MSAQISTDEGTEKRRKKVRFHWPIVWSIVGGFATVAGVAVIFAVIKDWTESEIEREVDRRILDDAVLRKVAGKMRPSLVFDLRGSIIADLGAFELIRTLKVVPKEDRIPESVVIEFTKPLSLPPNISAMNNDIVTIIPTRGEGTTWNFTFTYVATVGPLSEPRQFRLDVYP